MCFLYSAPISLFDCLEDIQKRVGLIIPRGNTLLDWSSTPRMEIAVRRSHLLEDALAEGHKTTFNPKRMLKVATLHIITLSKATMSHVGEVAMPRNAISNPSSPFVFTLLVGKL